MICENCKKENSNESSFCSYCGEKLETEKPTQAFCNTCGEKLKKNAQFCPTCGAPTENNKVHKSNPNIDPYATEQNEKYSQDTSIWGFVMGFFFGLAGLFIGLMIYPPETTARKTFVKSWGITFGVIAAFAALMCIILVFAFPHESTGYYYY